jgi:cardiolipin synthase
MTKTFRKIEKVLFSRMVIIGALIVLQLAMLLLIVLRLSRWAAAIDTALLVLSAIMALVVINREDNPSYKLAWIIPILLFPLFGGLFYLLFGTGHLNREQCGRMRATCVRMQPMLEQGPGATELLRGLPPPLQRQSEYLLRAGYPAYTHTRTDYHALGEEGYAAMLRALERAERYIFLEYFIVEEGVMWDGILEILERKAQQGVEVRMIYDGFGSLLTLPDNYFKTLCKKGIRCIEFNPLIPVLTMLMNNRDHRKIMVVDGVCGFMGGINIADEYINAKVRYGHWKDSVIELRGKAVWSLSVMFLNMWEGICGEAVELEDYLPLPQELSEPDNGLVQPYADSPLDQELVGEMVYLNIINQASRYLYICTPYLIVDNETMTALLLAAKSGVDVRIITPHIADKRTVHLITRAHYTQLVRGGVKIYEYEPGFLHAKSFVADDEVATVGTINLDYRSFYLHFECGVWMSKTSAVSAIRDDFLKTLEQCIEIKLDSPLLQVGLWQRMLRAVLRLFSPLM